MNECRDILRTEKLERGRNGDQRPWRLTWVPGAIPDERSPNLCIRLKNQVCLSTVDDTTSYLMPQQINTLIQVKGIDKPKVKPWYNSRKEHRQSRIRSIGFGV